MECICALDQGTQSTRAILFDNKAQVIAKHQVEFEQHTPAPGWVEHDPKEILDTITQCVAGALKTAEESYGKVKVVAVGLTNQRETTLAWDKKTGQPLHNAIVWLDGRTAGICAQFKEQLGTSDYFRSVTGLPISTYFSAYKYRWLVENVPAVKKAVDEHRCLIGTMDTWIIYNLTGGINGGVLVTDVTNASRTNLLDLSTLSWHEPTLKLFGLREDMLPSIKTNAEVYGDIKEGPLARIPISGCLGDQQAALLGQVCKEGEAKNTYGTGCFLLLNTGPNAVQSTHGLLTTLAYQLGPKVEAQYALEGSIAVAGMGIKWLQTNLGIVTSPKQTEELASSVKNTGGVYFVPAFSGLLAPRWRDDARGVILGITSHTTAAHIVRAMLEAIAWQTREVLDAMKDDVEGLHLAEFLRVDGGASTNDLLMQMQADVLQLRVQRPQMLESTARGAAFAAGIGSGFWTVDWVLKESLGGLPPPSEFQPSVTERTTAVHYARWSKAVSRSFGLSDLAESDNSAE